jgi:hypothetical protein
MFSIGVRTYQRPDIFHSHTLRILREHNLTELLTVFVGSEIEPYRALDPDIQFFPVPKGGNAATAGICAHYPANHPIVFMDDDISEYFEIDASGTKLRGDLRASIERGFSHSEVFMFSPVTNRYWMRMREPITKRYGIINGYAYGARNRPELIVSPSANLDETWRSVQYLKRGIVPIVLNHCSMSTVGWGCTTGGMQSSGDRNEERTLAESNVISEELRGWVKPARRHPTQPFWCMSLLPAATIKRKVREILSG